LMRIARVLIESVKRGKRVEKKREEEGGEG
jgi:hypothetical protein